MSKKTKIGGLGEIALRVRNLDAMYDFYSEIIELEAMSRSETIAFFKIAEGFAGHTQVLALFDRSQGEAYVAPESDKTSVDHFAFTIDRSDFEDELDRLKSLGLEVTTAEHDWVKWRSLYINDPEGNLVELVCYDESI